MRPSTVLPASDLGSPRSSAAKDSGDPRPPATSSIVPDQHAHHVPHEGVCLDPELEHVPRPGPARIQDVSLEADVVGPRGSEGREVVRASKQCRTCGERRLVQRVRPPQRAPLLERAGRCAREQPVAVGPRAGVAASVERVGRRLGGAHREVGREHSVQRACKLLRLQLARVGEAGHLSPGVHARIRATRDGQVRSRARDLPERGAERPLDGPQPRLRRPSGELAPVVFERELDYGAGAARRARERPSPWSRTASVRASGSACIPRPAPRTAVRSRRRACAR